MVDNFLGPLATFQKHIPSDKRLHNYIENHHIFHGNIHSFYGDFP